MADLNQIVGAIMRDITEARTSADFATREVSRYYGGDDIMKYFPVPRVEIKDLTFDLRFVVSNVQQDETRTSAKTLKLTHLADDIARTASTEIMNRLSDEYQHTTAGREALQKLDGSGLIEQLSKEFQSSLVKGEIRPEGLKESLTRALSGTTIKQEADTGPFKIEAVDNVFYVSAVDTKGETLIRNTQEFKSRSEALKSIEQLLKQMKAGTVQIDTKTVDGKYVLKDTGSRSTEISKYEVLKAPESELMRKNPADAFSQLLAQSAILNYDPAKLSAKEIEVKMTLPKDFNSNEWVARYTSEFERQKKLIELNMNDLKVEVLVSGDDLQKVPEAAISSLKFSTGIRNYIWSTDENNNPESLIPEP